MIEIILIGAVVGYLIAKPKLAVKLFYMTKHFVLNVKKEYSAELKK